MVDVSGKSDSKRTGRAHAFVKMSQEALAALPDNPKGDPLTIARIAGITAAKRTADLIPLCHPLGLTHADVAIMIEAGRPAHYRVRSDNRAHGRPKWRRSLPPLSPR